LAAGELSEQGSSRSRGALGASFYFNPIEVVENFCRVALVYVLTALAVAIRDKKLKNRKDAKDEKKEKEEDTNKKLGWLLKKEGLMAIQI
jgi:hypothetical protein